MVRINDQQLLTMLPRKQYVLITRLSKDRFLNSRSLLAQITLTTYHRDTLDDDN